MRIITAVSIFLILLVTNRLADVAIEKYDTPYRGSTSLWIGHDRAMSSETILPKDTLTTFYSSTQDGSLTAICTIDGKGKRSKGCTCALPDFARLFCEGT